MNAWKSTGAALMLAGLILGAGVLASTEPEPAAEITPALVEAAKAAAARYRVGVIAQQMCRASMGTDKVVAVLVSPGEWQCQRVIQK